MKTFISYGAIIVFSSLSFTATAVADTSKIDTPQWSFQDNFEGSKDNAFWAGDGVYVNYGVIDPTNSNNKVMEMRYVPNSEGAGDSWSEYDFHLGANAVQVELGWKMYIPPNYHHIERNHKVFALWSGTYGKVNANISVSSEAWGQNGGATPSVYIGEDGNNYGHAMLSTNPNLWRDSNGTGRWIDVVVVLELAEREGDYGKMEIFLDGVLLTGTHHDDLTKPYSSAPEGPERIPFSSRGNFIDQGTILGWANGDIGFTEETVFLIDDFYINANSEFSTITWADGSPAAAPSSPPVPPPSFSAEIN